MYLPRLRKARELRGLSRAELAERSGLGPRTVAKYETGGNARPHKAREVAEALDVDLWWLAGEVEPVPKGAAPAYPSSLSEQDRRTIDALDDISRTLEHRLGSGTLDAATCEIARRYHDGIAPTLARIMHKEASALRKLHPEAHDVGPWATAGPAVARYIAVSMKVLDAGDDLDRERREAYRLVG